MDYSTVMNAITSAKTAAEMLKMIVAVRDDAKAAEAVAEVKQHLATAYESLFSVVQQSLNVTEQLTSAKDEIQSLKAENQRLHLEAEERNRYALADIGGGVMAYRLKPDDQSGEPLHYLCQPCMAKGHKSVLQPHGERGNFICNVCKTVYLIDRSHWSRRIPYAER